MIATRQPGEILEHTNLITLSANHDHYVDGEGSFSAYARIKDSYYVQ